MLEARALDQQRLLLAVAQGRGFDFADLVLQSVLQTRRFALLGDQQARLLLRCAQLAQQAPHVGAFGMCAGEPIQIVELLARS